MAFSVWLQQPLRLVGLSVFGGDGGDNNASINFGLQRKLVMVVAFGAGIYGHATVPFLGWPIVDW